MKVLFLDVDGVLNTSKSMSLYSLSKPRLSRLREIVRDTGCKLVLSSTWRKDQFAVRKLQRNGLKFIGFTPDFSSDQTRHYRGYEIQHWLDEHPEVDKNYCIVDDDADMLDSQLRNFVQTTMEHGLTETHAYRIKMILDEGPWNIN